MRGEREMGNDMQQSKFNVPDSNQGRCGSWSAPEIFIIFLMLNFLL